MQTSSLMILIGNCCLMPIISFLAGYWIAKGMPGAPFAIVRRGGQNVADLDENLIDPYE